MEDFEGRRDLVELCAYGGQRAYGSGGGDPDPQGILGALEGGHEGYISYGDPPVADEPQASGSLLGS